MSRIAYFKTTSVIDANQDSAIAGLLTRIGATETALSSKADSSALADKADRVELQVARSDLENLIQGKASADYVDAAVAGKANAADVDANITALNSVLAAKADAVQVTAELQGKATFAYVDTAVASKADAADMDARLGQKADLADVNSRIAHENAFFDAFQTAIFLESAPGSGTEFEYQAHGLGNASTPPAAL